MPGGALTAAMEEAYAANDHSETIYETLEMDHVTFAEPVRIVTGVDEDMEFRIERNGALVPFKACAVNAILPGVTENGPTQAKVTIDNVASLLLPILNDAVQGDSTVKVTYRAYTSKDLSGPGEVIDGLELWEVDLDVMSATGTLKLREIELEAFPKATYDQTFYPGLMDP